MPVEYKGIIDEHLACRTAAGLFDVSHMGEIHVTGQEAPWPSSSTSPRTTPPASRRAMSSTRAPDDAQGTYVDDMLVYCLHPEFYLLVVNAANTDKDYAYVPPQKGSFKVILDNASDRYSQLALQGRKAIPILQPLTDIALAPMKSFTAAFGKVARQGMPGFADGLYGRGRLRSLHARRRPRPDLGRHHRSGQAARPSTRRPRRPRHAPPRSQAPALRQRHRRHDDPPRSGFQVDRQIQEGRLPRPRCPRPAERAGDHPQARRLRARRQGHRPAALSRSFSAARRSARSPRARSRPLFKKSIGLVYLPIDKTAIGTEFEIGIRDKKAKAVVVPTPFYKEIMNERGVDVAMPKEGPPKGLAVMYHPGDACILAISLHERP